MIDYPNIATRTTLQRAFQFESVDHDCDFSGLCVDPTAPTELVVSELMRPIEMRAASEAAQGIAYDTLRFWREECVYVVKQNGSTKRKIGVSCNPLTRLQALQNLSETALSFAGLVWLIDSEAFTLEKMALNEAGRRGKRMNGEWVSLTSKECLTMIVERARDAGVRFATSAMHLDNMQTAQDAVDRAKYDYLLSEWGGQRAAMFKIENQLDFAA